MPKLASLGRDGRPYIDCDWYVNGQPPRSCIFLIDSGSTCSTIDDASAQGMLHRGYTNVSAAVRSVREVEILDGGALEFAVEDSETGQTIVITHRGLWLRTGMRIMGVNVARDQHLDVQINYGGQPPSVRIRRQSPAG